MYYKNKKNEPYFEPTEEVIIRDSLVEITEEEFEQIVYEINNPPLTDDQLLAQQKAEAKQYLNNTDWYIIRKIETGVLVPNDVSTKRDECKKILNT